MADDDNNTGAELPTPTPREEEEEENSVVGDIVEQGRPSSSWVAAAVSGRTWTDDPSTTMTTTWPQGGLEHVDVEEAAPVLPLIQQIADMEIEKDDTKANTHANVAPSENVSTTPQPPTQDAMEQIEDGDDGAAPRPLNYAEFEDESEPKLDLGEESADEDDGPPLPLPFLQRDSLMAATSQISSSEAASSIDHNESVRGDATGVDEENILQSQRVVRPETRSASDNEGARQVVSAPERYPSVPMLEAYLVEDEGPPTAVVATPPPSVPVVTPGGHDTVYEATPLEPELPWWKQRRTKVFMVIICALITTLLAVLREMSFSRPPSNTAATATSSVPSYRCFADRNELKAAVDRYVNDGCGADAALCRNMSEYGWPMGSWCVIDMTDMSSLFKGLDAFNEDVSMWNVSQVTDMSYMFAETGTFNRDISSWNVSSVTNMSYMFQSATSFNQNLCAWQDHFPYSDATDIFLDSGCAYKGTPSSAHQGPFCASSCNTVSPTDCFTTHDELKAAVDRYVQGYWGTTDSSKYGWPIGSWCVGKVTDMSELFKDLSSFNEDVSGWEVGQVTDVEDMFYGASSFNQDLSAWNTSSVTQMSGMFYDASAFNGNISSWNMSAVTDMSFMFYTASSFNHDLSKWDTSSVTTMESMFDGASAFNDNISSWDISTVTDMEDMFYGASSFNQDLFQWNTSSVTQMSGMFYEASAFDGNISSWNTSAVADMSYMFYGASSFNQEDLSKWDTSAVTTMRSMFYEASAFNGNISSWDTSAVTDTRFMFYKASSFKQEDLSNWDTSAVTTMESMFDTASAFDGNISSWDTSAVTDMSYMFREASSFNQDLSKWNTSAVTTMESMFDTASAFDGNISSWDTSAVTDMSFMFWGASSFNQEDLSNWDTSAVITMREMFLGASSFNGSISSWNTSAVTDMSYMFKGATSFNQNLCPWKDNFPYSNATDIFLDSGCTFQGSSQIEQQGPFCASDCTKINS